MPDNVAYGASIFGVAGSFLGNVKIATGTATSTTAYGSFTEYGGTVVTSALTELSIPVPNGANGIIAVFAQGSAMGVPPQGIYSGNPAGYDMIFASPQGYAQGASSPTILEQIWSSNIGRVYGMIAGGNLSIGTGSIVLAAGQQGGTYYYTVLYY